MFSVRNVPVVIEPGVGALEAEFTSVGDTGNREFPVQLGRVNLEDTIAAQLPFVPCTQFPHVFSILPDLTKSTVLVIYDMRGRLSIVYTRSAKEKAWERNDVAEEHAGKTVTQFSVRFNFSSTKDRAQFLALTDKLVRQVKAKDTLDNTDVVRALTLLGRSRVAPVVLPVAVDKLSLKNVAL
jgi:hypothetical protein